MSDDVTGHVIYSAKELFEKVDAKLDAVLDRLDGKATKADLLMVEQRVEKLERHDVVRYAAANAQARWVKLALALATLAIAAAGVVASFLALN